MLCIPADLQKSHVFNLPLAPLCYLSVLLYWLFQVLAKYLFDISEKDPMNASILGTFSLDVLKTNYCKIQTILVVHVIQILTLLMLILVAKKKTNYIKAVTDGTHKFFQTTQ